MEITKGWKFHSADFSMHRTGKYNVTGFVLLMRDDDETDRWLHMPEEIHESENTPPLYIAGHGMTLEDAITAANLIAANAKPIPVKRMPQ